MKIDNEFRAMLPPLSDDERRVLRESIEREGVRDPLTVWAEEGILLDGHNRMEIAAELHVSYKTNEISLPDREAAKDWIDRNQLGRRNLDPTVASLVRGRIYNRAKGPIGGVALNKIQRQEGRVADRLAVDFGVTGRTIYKDAALASAVEELRPVVPDLEAKIMSGHGPFKRTVIQAAKAARENPETAIKILREREERPRGQLRPRITESERIEVWIDNILNTANWLSECDVSETPEEQVKRLRTARTVISGVISKMEGRV